MKSVQLAWFFGAVAAFGLGMGAEACSSSTTGGSSSTSSSGASSSSHSSGSVTSSASSSSTVVSGSSSAECFSIATTVYAEDGGEGVYCPFSGSGSGSGGKDINCPKNQHCCVPPESANELSTCEPEGTACADPSKAVDWVCEGTPDCVNAGMTGTICCGQGKIYQQGEQIGCAKDGGNLPPSSYVSGFYGTACQTSCAVFQGDGGAGFQVCSKDSECPSGQVCLPVKPKGNSIGYCGVSDAGTTSSSSAASSAGSSTGSSSSEGSSSTATSGSTSGSGSSSGSGG